MAPSVKLPMPVFEGKQSVESALYYRRSRRNYICKPLSLQKTGQMLWAAGGVGKSGVTGSNRTFPSAGATYATEIYLVAGNIEGLEAGLYRYVCMEHSLEPRYKGDIRSGLSEAAYGQMFIAEAAASILLIAVPQRTIRRYRERGVRYIYMETGCIAQNIYLQAEALGLGTVCVGAFDDDRIRNLIDLNPEEEPEMIMPIGAYS